MNMERCEEWSEERWEEYKHDRWWMIQELRDEYYKRHEQEEEPEDEEEVLRSLEWKEQEEITKKEYFRRLKEDEIGDEIKGPNNAFNSQESKETTRDSEQENMEDEAQSSKEMDVQRNPGDEDTSSQEMDGQESLESSKEKDKQRRGNIIQVKEKDDSESPQKAQIGLI